LVTHSLRWEDVEIRGYGEAAIAVGCHDQRAEYQGSNVDARLRATHILIRREDGWRLAGMHLSPIGGPPPGAPRAAQTRATEGEAR
jgi:ketosteroid isomerase-like protein